MIPQKVSVLVWVVLFTLVGASAAWGKDAKSGTHDRSGACPPTLDKEPAYQPGEVLVKFKDGTTAGKIAAINREHGTSIIRFFHHTGVYLLKLPAGTEVEAATRLFQEMPQVEYAEPNYRAGIDCK